MHSVERLREIRAYEFFLRNPKPVARPRKALLRTRISLNFQTGAFTMEESRIKKDGKVKAR